jgi:hypothetical protein
MFERLRRHFQRRRPESVQPTTAPVANESLQPETVQSTPSPDSGPSMAQSLMVAAAAATRLAADQEQQTDQRIVMINKRRYAWSALSEEVRQLLLDLHKADELVRIRRQRVLVLAQGRLAIRERVRQALTSVTPMDEQTDSRDAASGIA